MNSQFTYDQLVSTTERAPDHHDDLLTIMDLIRPESSLDEKLTKAWTTGSVLCSATRSGGEIPSRIEVACRTSWTLDHVGWAAV